MDCREGAHPPGFLSFKVEYMAKQKTYFNVKAAQWNKEWRRRMMKPYALAKKLARLTGEVDGRKIYKKIRHWKRVHDSQVELSQAFDYWGIDGIWRVMDNWRVDKGHPCAACGRWYKDLSYFPHGKRICNRCMEIHAKKGFITPHMEDVTPECIAGTSGRGYGN